MDDTIPDGYAQHTINILRVAAGHRATAFQALLDLEGTLIGKLATAQTLNNAARLQALLDQTKASISRTYALIEKNHLRDLRGLAGLEAKATKKIVGAAIGADVLSVAMTENQLAAVTDHPTVMGHRSGDWWKKQDAALQYGFAGQMQQGMLMGETNDQLIQRVRGTKANAFNDGLMAASRREAAALVRTSAISTANAARIETMKQMDDVVKGIQWVATLDSRTTHICMGLSGKMWRLPDYQPVGHDKAWPGPTAHWNCRSTQVPVLRSWEELSGKKLPSLDEQELADRVKQKLAAKGMSPEQIATATTRSRASMDGQVNESLTFDDWLKKKDDTFIDGMLGPGRAKLWNRGRGQISLTDLTDQNNRPLTLAQLADHIENGTDLPETLGVEFFQMTPEGLKAVQLEPEGPTAAELAAAAAAAEAAALAAAAAQEAAAALAAKKAAQEAAEAELQALANTGKTKLEQELAAEALMAGKRITPETLAKVKATAAAKLEAKATAQNISQAKKKYLAGQPFTAAQLKALDSLPLEQKQDYLDTWATLKAAEDAKLAAAALNAEAVGKMDDMAWKMANDFPLSATDQALIGALKPEQITELVAKANAIKAADAAIVTLEGITTNPAMLDKMTGNDPELTKTAMQAVGALPAGHPAAKQFFDAVNEAQQVKKTAAILQNVSDENFMFYALDPKGETSAIADSIKHQLETLPDNHPTKVAFLAKAAKKKAELTADYVNYLSDPGGWKPPTDEQYYFWESLDAEQQNAIIALAQAKQKLQNLEATEAAAAAVAPAKPKRVRKKKEPAPTTPEEVAALIEVRPVVPAQPLIPDDFPKDPAKLKVVRTLGGSTGAQLVEDATGRQFVRKGGASADHVRSEFAADRLYAAFGLDVPRGALYNATGSSPVKLTEYLPGKEFSSLTGADKATAVEQLKKGFAVDALLGNWDVVGMSGDNVLFAGGKVYRIDNGGALNFRAQGGLKTPDDWNEYPTELHSMRESPQGQPVFGDLDIYQIADQIAALPEDAIDSVGMPAEVAAVLKGRLAQMKAVSERAGRFRKDKFKAEAFDKHTRQMVQIRKAGIDQNLLGATTRNGTIVLDSKTGRSFGNLRAAQSHTGTANPTDPWYATILNGVKTVNAHFTKGDAANASTLAQVVDLKATLKSVANGGGPMAGMAKEYLQTVEKLEAELPLAKAGKKPSGMMANFSKVEPVAKPGNPQAPTGSVVEQLHENLKKQLIAKGQSPAQAATATRLWLEWTDSQGANSWNPMPKGAKYWMWKQRDVPTTANFWGGQTGKGTIDQSREEYLKMVKQAGGEENLDTVFHAHHALMQEQLAKVDVDYNDRDAKATLLMRTEHSSLLDKKRAGSITQFLRGSTESHSIFNPTYVKGDTLTVQAVPHSRVLWSYWFEDAAGSGSPGFLGDGENEFAADSSNLPMKVFGHLYSHPVPASRKVEDWAKAGIPVDHLK